VHEPSPACGRVRHRAPAASLPPLPADRAWDLRENVSFYDGLYVALAEQLEALLLTLDARLAEAPGVRAQIELVQAA